MKKTFLWLALVFLPAVSYAAGLESNPVLQSFGNSWRLIEVTASTNNVLISSYPSRAQEDMDWSTRTPMGVTKWEYREICNNADGGLFLQPSAKYSTYIDSFGVVLSSDTAGLGYGDCYEVPHQGEVWGIWSVGTSTTGAGAGGEEIWEDPKKRRDLIP